MIDETPRLFVVCVVKRVALIDALNWVSGVARSGTHHFEKIRVLKAGEVFFKRCLSLEQVSME